MEMKSMEREKPVTCHTTSNTRMQVSKIKIKSGEET